jgi:hypothetical protein
MADSLENSEFYFRARIPAASGFDFRWWYNFANRCQESKKLTIAIPGQYIGLERSGGFGIGAMSHHSGNFCSSRDRRLAMGTMGKLTSC